MVAIKRHNRNNSENYWNTSNSESVIKSCPCDIISYEGRLVSSIDTSDSELFCA